MIKRVIFDLDNTLIDFPKDYEIHFQSVLDKHNLNIKGKDLFKAIGSYELDENTKYYEIDKLLNTVNKTLNLNCTKELLEDFFLMYNKLITPVSSSVIETLEYLKDKYELVILTNWFTNSQKERLKEAGILKYFDKVYGTDIIPMKPYKECFNEVIGDLKPNECVMIGDNLNIDIKVPYEMGMNVFHLNKFGNTKFPTIRKIEDLKEEL